MTLSGASSECKILVWIVLIPLLVDDPLRAGKKNGYETSYIMS